MNTRPLRTQALTTAQAADRLGVSTQTVQKWVDLGLLEAWRTLGGHRRVSAMSVQTLIDKRNATPGNTEIARGPDRPGCMVVEDDPIDADLIVQNLRAAYDKEISITVFDNAFDALLEAGHNPPAALLTDVNMPGLDGIAMVRRLVSNELMSTTRIALVTHFARDELERYGELPEGVLYLRKPVSAQVLKDAFGARIDA